MYKRKKDGLERKEKIKQEERKARTENGVIDFTVFTILLRWKKIACSIIVIIKTEKRKISLKQLNRALY